MFNRFIYKVFLFFVIPIVFIGLIELFLPINFFTFRNYEALKFSNERIPHIGPFYPNKFLKMNSVGDLCSHSKFAVIKKEIWKTDKLGFRNTIFHKKSDIVVFGSSFIYGTGLSQSQTFNAQLARKMNCTVYNFAPNSINDFELLVRKDSLEYPKVIIYAIGDWYVPSKYKGFTKTTENSLHSLVKSFFYGGFNNCLDRSTRFYSFFWCKSKMLKTNHFYQSKQKTNMFFGRGDKYVSLNSNQINAIIKNLKNIQSFCKSKKIKFFYVTTPSKEIVYRDFINNSIPSDFYSKLTKKLGESNIHGIDGLKIFNQYRKKSSKLLYHSDDTHWNKLGVDLVTNEICKVISLNNKERI
jgi:hypothetical protein